MFKMFFEWVYWVSYYHIFPCRCRTWFRRWSWALLQPWRSWLKPSMVTSLCSNSCRPTVRIIYGRSLSSPTLLKVSRSVPGHLYSLVILKLTDLVKGLKVSPIMAKFNKLTDLDKSLKVRHRSLLWLIQITYNPNIIFSKSLE